MGEGIQMIIISRYFLIVVIVTFYYDEDFEIHYIFVHQNKSLYVQFAFWSGMVSKQLWDTRSSIKEDILWSLISSVECNGQAYIWIAL